MENIELTEEELKTVELKIKINGLNRIATVIPTRFYLDKLFQIPGRIKKKPDVVEYDRYNIGRCLRFGEETNNIVKKFIGKLEEHSDKINVNTVYENLKGTRIIESELSIVEKLMRRLGLTTRSGYYSTRNNSIHLNTDANGKSESTITHELLHLSSTVAQGNTIYTGFEQFNNLTNTSIGRGINEGSTEFLNCYLFDYPYRESSYNELVYIVRGIANLIGTENLMELYFNNDLKGLEEEISKYSDKETARTLITGLDRLYSLRYQELINKPLSTAQELEESLISLVASLNLKKQRERLSNNEISRDEYEINCLETAYFYELGITVHKKINPENKKTLYTISTKYEDIIVTEEEYIDILEKCKKIVQNSKNSKDHKTSHINITINQIREDRRAKITNIDNIYGTTEGYTDTLGNSLDNIQFNYKSFAEQMDKAGAEEKDKFTIYDKDNNPYTIDMITAELMKGAILKSCEKDYVNRGLYSNKHDEELKEILEDSDNKEQEKTSSEDILNK